MFALNRQQTELFMVEDTLSQNANSNLRNFMYEHTQGPVAGYNDLEMNKTPVSRNEVVSVSLDTGMTETYTDDDVLSGRGSAINVHPGNIHFRLLIDENRRTYLNTKWLERRAIAKSIVASIHAKGGRFLKQNEGDNGFWFDIGEKGAIDKTTQALRQMKMRRKLMVDDEKKGNATKGVLHVPPKFRRTQVDSHYDTLGNTLPSVDLTSLYSFMNTNKDCWMPHHPLASTPGSLCFTHPGGILMNKGNRNELMGALLDYSRKVAFNPKG